MNLLFAPLNAYFAMLLVGSAHSYDARVPAFGYLVTLLLVAALSLIVPDASSGKND